MGEQTKRNFGKVGQDAIFGDFQEARPKTPQPEQPELWFNNQGQSVQHLVVQEFHAILSAEGGLERRWQFQDSHLVIMLHELVEEIIRVVVEGEDQNCDHVTAKVDVDEPMAERGRYKSSAKTIEKLQIGDHLLLLHIAFGVDQIVHSISVEAGIESK